MITNKDIRVENGNLILNGDKYPLDGQSPEAIMEIVEDNSDTTPTENSDAPITSGGVYTALANLIKSTGERQFTFSNGTCTFDLKADIDTNAYELINVFSWGSDIPLAFSLVNWNLRRYKVYHLTNPTYTGTLAASLTYRL